MDYKLKKGECGLLHNNGQKITVSGHFYTDRIGRKMFVSRSTVLGSGVFLKGYVTSEPVTGKMLFGPSSRKDIMKVTEEKLSTTIYDTLELWNRFIAGSMSPEKINPKLSDCQKFTNK